MKFILVENTIVSVPDDMEVVYDDHGKECIKYKDFFVYPIGETNVPVFTGPFKVDGFDICSNITDVKNFIDAHVMSESELIDTINFLFGEIR